MTKRKVPPALRGMVSVGDTHRADLYAAASGEDEMRAAVLSTIRRSGCNCDVEITVLDGSATCRHDDWCDHPAMRD